MTERALVADAASVLLDPVAGAVAELLDGPIGRGDADDRDVERPPLRHVVERGEDLLVREVARHSEERDRVGGYGLGHGCSYSAGFSTWPPNSLRIADNRRLA